MSIKLLFTSLLLTLMSCSQFHTGRSYLSEMDNDDSAYFGPNEDFPVVAGDTGKYGNSEKEQSKRTPASEFDLAEDRRSRSLREELRSLENSQSEENLNRYEKHKHQLVTVSEKIYYLKLLPSERHEYLLSRGLISLERPMGNAHERMFATRQKDILLGMNKNEVTQSLGRPVKVEVAGNPQNENERWLYKMNGASKFIYFESGQVQGWE